MSKIAIIVLIKPCKNHVYQVLSQKPFPLLLDVTTNLQLFTSILQISTPGLVPAPGNVLCPFSATGILIIWLVVTVDQEEI